MLKVGYCGFFDLCELRRLVVDYQEVYVFFNNLCMWQDAEGF